MHIRHRRLWPLLVIQSVLATTMPEASAEEERGFWSDAKVGVSTSNFYYNRDFRSEGEPGQRTEWAQGAVLNFRSGWTPGPLALGLDTNVYATARLDTERPEEGIGLLQAGHDGVRGLYGRMAFTGKARLGPATLKVGSHVPKERVLNANTSRLMPQTFQGTAVEVSPREGLKLYAARYGSTWYRDGVGRNPLALFNKNDRFLGAPSSDGFWMAGADVTAFPDTTVRYQAGHLEDIYEQHSLEATRTVSIWGGRWITELRQVWSHETGRGLAGAIDNRLTSVSSSFARAGHRLTLGMQKSAGGTAMPWVNGTDGNVLSWSFVNDFLERGEKSAMITYEVSGDSLGLPGLDLSTRYISGYDARAATGGGTTEWERDVEVSYRFRHHALRHVRIRWLNGTFRSSFQRDVDENRIIIAYERPLSPVGL